MAQYKVCCAIVSALACASLVLAESKLELMEREQSLIKQLFDEKADYMDPFKVQEQLVELEDLYEVLNDFDSIADKKKENRYLIYTLSAQSVIDEMYCIKIYFVDSKDIIRQMETFPNIKHYLEYFLDKQFKNCKAKDPNFTVNATV